MSKQANTPRSTVFLFMIVAIIFFFSAGSFSCKKADTPSTDRWISSSDGLKMRNAPDTKGTSLGVIPHNTKVTFISETGETMTIAGATGKWTNIDWNGKKGFVFGGFLTNMAPSDSTPDSNEALVSLAKGYYISKVGQILKDVSSYTPEEAARFGENIRVKKRMGNFAVVEHNGFLGGVGYIEKQDALWVWNGSSWKEIFGVTNWRGRCALLNLNNDDLPDAVCTTTVSEVTTVKLFLGASASSMKRIEESDIRYEFIEEEGTHSFKLGKCGNTEIIARDGDTGKNIRITFDCEKNRFVKKELPK